MDLIYEIKTVAHLTANVADKRQQNRLIHLLLQNKRFFYFLFREW